MRPPRHAVTSVTDMQTGLRCAFTLSSRWREANRDAYFTTLPSVAQPPQKEVSDAKEHFAYMAVCSGCDDSQAVQTFPPVMPSDGWAHRIAAHLFGSVQETTQWRLVTFCGSQMPSLTLLNNHPVLTREGNCQIEQRPMLIGGCEATRYKIYYSSAAGGSLPEAHGFVVKAYNRPVWFWISAFGSGRDGERLESELDDIAASFRVEKDFLFLH